MRFLFFIFSPYFSKQQHSISNVHLIFQGAAPSDDSSDQGNNSASSVTPLKEKAYTNETSCEATHVSFSDMGKPHNSGRKITFEENVSEIRVNNLPSSNN